MDAPMVIALVGVALLILLGFLAVRGRAKLSGVRAVCKSSATIWTTNRTCQTRSRVLWQMCSSAIARRLEGLKAARTELPTS